MKIIRFFSKKKLIPDILLIILLVFLSYYAWRLLPDQIIRGGSNAYLISQSLNAWFGKGLYALTGYEVGAALTSVLFLKFFGVNIALYYWTELIVMTVINICFYIFVRVISKKSFVAFAAALILAVNYYGQWDMVVSCYCHLGERMLSLPFLLLSFIYLHLFLDRSNKMHYVLSLIFYFIGVGLGHFSLLFTGPYLFYPIFWYFFLRKKITDARKGFIIGMAYLGISVFFVFIQPRLSNMIPFFEFLLHPSKYNYPYLMLRELVYWSQYPTLLDAMLNRNTHELQNVPSVANAIAITPYVVVVYILTSIVIYKKLPKLRPMLFTIIFGTASVFYLNAWFGQYVIIQQVGTHRYLYFPTFLLAIYWSLFLWAAFLRQKSWKNLLVAIFILAVYYKINFTLIGDSFFQMTWANTHTRALTDYFVNIRKNLSKNTLVVGQYPAVGIYEAIFYTEQLGKGEVRFASENDPYDDWRNIASTSAHIIKLSFDNNCGCVREKKIK